MRTMVTEELVKSTMGIGTLPRPQLQVLLQPTLQLEPDTQGLLVQSQMRHSPSQPLIRRSPSQETRVQRPARRSLASGSSARMSQSPSSARMPQSPTGSAWVPQSPPGSARNPQSPNGSTRKSMGNVWPQSPGGSPRVQQGKAMSPRTQQGKGGSVRVQQTSARQATKQYLNSMGSSGGSPRTSKMDRASRDSCPFHGKLAWQGRQTEETPGLRYAGQRLDFGKGLPGSCMDGAPRFSPGVEHYPTWLLERRH